MQIGQLARHAGVPIDTLRYYERRGLLSPHRRPSGYRSFGADDLTRLNFIRRSKALGFSLDEIAELLQLASAQDADRSEVRALASRRLADVEQRLLDLQAVRDTLHGLVQACSGQGPVRGCPIIERVLGADAVSGAP